MRVHGLLVAALVSLAAGAPSAAGAVDVEEVVHRFITTDTVHVTLNATVSGADARNERSAADTDGDGTVSTGEAQARTAHFEGVIEGDLDNGSTTLDGASPTAQQVVSLALEGFMGAADAAEPFDIRAEVRTTYATNVTSGNLTYRVDVAALDLEAGSTSGVRHVFEAPAGHVVGNVTGLAAENLTANGTFVSGTSTGAPLAVTFTAGEGVDEGAGGPTRGDGGGSAPTPMPALLVLVAALVALALRRPR